MGASTKKISTAPAGSDALRGGIIDYLTKQGFDKIGAQSTGPVSVAPWQTTGFDRGQIRDVTGRDTQSVDQLGGVNSAFFNNMMGQLAPAFDTQRQLAAAQGKEASGNLTGSGFANRLGNTLNRTLGDQQALLANYASQGLQTEVGRQQGDANRNLQGQIANQGADQGFLNTLLTGRGQDLSARGQDISLGVSNADRASSEANANANRYAQLLMQQGQPYQDAIVQSGGAGALLGPLAQGLGGYYGAGGKGNPISGIGGLIGKGLGALGGIFGIGGGGDPTGGIAAGNKTAGGIDFGSLGIPGLNMQTTGTNSFMPGENNVLHGIMSGGQGGLGGVLGQILGLGGNANPYMQGASGLLGMLGGQGGGFNASNVGGLLGGIAGNAIPIPILGPILGSILGKGIGGVAGKVGGGIKHLLGKIF